MQFPNTSGIYQILNLVNGKIYVGSAANLRDRRKQHFTKLRCKRHSNRYLQNSFNKYGENNFEFKILQLVEYKKNLIDCEQYWIDKTDCANRKYGYNIALRAQSNLGFKFPEEAKKILSKQRKGKKLSKEHKQNISKALIGHKRCLGNKLTEEHKKKISSSVKKVLANPAVRKKISIANSGENNYMYGKTHTLEARQKISETHKGKKLTSEVKERLRLSCTGENNRHAKLNELQVKIIRSLTNELNTKYLTLQDLAEYFNVSLSVIGKVKLRISWRHI